jgi:nucleoside-diphosphate-sugar epimerase
MDILITGAGGFIGQALAAALLSDPAITKITLTDIMTPQIPETKTKSSAQTNCVKADLTDKAACEQLITSNLTHIYLLHGLMSGAAEANLDLGLRVNVDSTRLVLDIVRKFNNGTKVVFPSSLAVFGPSDGQVITEGTMPQPGSSYGAEKLICEILINNFSRRGLIDGRIVRLPTIIVRPGAPSGAASSFCSGIIREPLKGEVSQLPTSRDLKLWVCSTRTVIKNLVLAKDVGRSRVINLPGITVTVEQMLAALEGVGGQDVLALIEEKRDPAIEKIVGSWPAVFDTALAKKLGFHDDGPLERTIQEYIEDYGQ